MKDKLLRTYLLLLLFLTISVSSSATIFYVINVNDIGVGSLRQAIDDANSHGGRDTIYFNLTGTGPFKIQLIHAFSVITSPILIDGFSQPFNNDSVYSVVIDGTSYNVTSATDITTFKINSSDCEFKGLKITDLQAVIIGVSEAGPKAIRNTIIKKNRFINCGKAILLKNYGMGNGLNLIHNTLIDSNYVFNNYAFISFAAGGISTSLSNISDAIISNNIIDSTFSGCNFSITEVGLNKNIYINNNFFNNCERPLIISAGGALTYYSNINISNNFFTNSKGDVIYLFCGSTAYDHYYIDSITIMNNTIHNSMKNGSFNKAIYFSLGGTGNNRNELSNIKINNNNIDSVSNAFFIDGSVISNSTIDIDSVDIMGNHISNLEAGINIYLLNESSSNSTYKNFNISNNIISNCNKEGILIQSIINGMNYTRTGNFNIIHNSISFCNESGIKLFSTSICGQARSSVNYFNIEENSIFNNTKYGIEQINYAEDTLCFTIKSLLADHTIISKNEIFNNGYKGLNIQDLSYNNYLFNGYEYPIPLLDYVSNTHELLGHINGEPNTKYKLEFFTNQVPDLWGYGEGETFVGFDSVFTDGLGYGTFNYPLLNLNSSLYISATATDQNHFNTSEFSNCISLTVGLNNLSFAENKILISPNPANSEAVLKAPGISGKLYIFNNVGQVIDKFEFTSEYKLSLEKYKPSLYLVKLYTDKNSILNGKLSVFK